MRVPLARLLLAAVLASACASASASALALAPAPAPASYKVVFLPSYKSKVGKLVNGAFLLAMRNFYESETYTKVSRKANVSYALVVVEDEFTALRVMAEHYTCYNRSLLAFFGPEQTCDYEAKLAAAWNIPLVGYRCTDKTMSIKKLYPTFFRTNTAIAKVSRSIIAVLKHFNWDLFVLVKMDDLDNEGDREWTEIALELERLCIVESIRITSTINVKASWYNRPTWSDEMLKEVRETSQRGHIYVLLAPWRPVNDFMRSCAQLLDMKQRAVIAVQDPGRRIGDSTVGFDFRILPSGIDSDYVYRHLLIISPHEVTNATQYRQFGTALSAYTSQLYNISARPHGIEVTAPVYAASLYDAVMVYMQALEKVLDKGQDPRNASAILSYVLGKSYRSIQGFDIHINQDGDAEGNYSVFIHLPSSLNGTRNRSLSLVGQFLLDPSQGGISYKEIRKIEWLGAEVPKGEPRCGFDGFRCRVSPQTIMLIVAVTVGSLLVLVIVLIFSCRHYLYEQKLARLLWKIEPNELVLLDKHGNVLQIDVRAMDGALSAEQRALAAPSVAYRRRTQSNSSYQRKHFASSSGTQRPSPFASPAPLNKFLNGAQSWNFLIPDDNASLFIPEHNEEFFRTHTLYGNGALYRNQIVHVKYLKRSQHFSLNRSLKRELQSLKDLNHENLNKFIGACILEQRGLILLVSQYCCRGSLQDLLDHHLRPHSQALDPIFISSLVFDLIKGITYLHETTVGAHGNLRPSKCLIDSRWVLQIAGFGLPRLRTHTQAVANLEAALTAESTRKSSASANANVSANSYNASAAANHNDFSSRSPYPLENCHNIKVFQKLLWRAPELLRGHVEPFMLPSNSQTSSVLMLQKADVYSFSMILYELLARRSPWGRMRMSAREIVLNLSDGEFIRPCIEELRGALDGPDCCWYPNNDNDTPVNNPTISPSIRGLDVNAIIRCVEDCWTDVPEQRPDFKQIRWKLRSLARGLRSNIVDNMLLIMEKYAHHLEDVVHERTVQLAEEKSKLESLLLRMLPKSVTEQILRGEKVRPELYDCVTVYFSDLVGFTEFAAISTPMEVVDFLNELYTLFDFIIGFYGVYKVETIGDAYMVVSGLPIRNGDNHAGEIASMALHLLEDVRQFKIRQKPSEMVQLRIGIHSGPVVAGVVGVRMPRYCLFGDTVNTASRMESTGIALKIHISESTRHLLDKLGGYVMTERGIITVKGKGEMRTHFLEAEDKSFRQRRLKSVDKTMMDSRVIRGLNDDLPLSLSGSPESHHALEDYRTLTTNRPPGAELRRCSTEVNIAALCESSVFELFPSNNFMRKQDTLQRLHSIHFI